jgi:2-polyprenyl-6-methoxyphenol hydroxylase-like FAD-dependent oxidoreductase
MSEPMKSSLAVVIQGGGPVGLACAAWLLQKNPRINLILIDRNPEGDEQIHSIRSMLGHPIALRFIEFTSLRSVALVEL